MNVGTQLGLGEDSELLELARQKWPVWVAVDDRLAVVETFDGLRGWLRTADWEAADGVLLALAMLAAPDGGDDVAAAATLGYCLLPGACLVAARLTAGLGRAPWAVCERQSATVAQAAVVNELVASQLWIEVRSFPWRRRRKVAANILANTRAGVLRESGTYSQVRRVDRTWANTEPAESLTRGHSETDVMLEPDGTGQVAARIFRGPVLREGLLAAPEPDRADPEASAADEVWDLLAWACEHQVISPRDGYLLLCLVDEASRAEDLRTRGCGGLLGTELRNRVATRLGVHEATIRRRASASIRAIADAAPGKFVYEPLILDAA